MESNRRTRRFRNAANRRAMRGAHKRARREEFRQRKIAEKEAENGTQTNER